ncbi:hypothetical protein [Acidisphaera sp. L21]|uniref:hypothetical protein n=1 Tax=Acidisphaera sp. L21 TaxID=1641851 RepID=UPI00131CD9ED|nr:hypothetical protein [Acidisphaera sp. L21]
MAISPDTAQLAHSLDAILVKLLAEVHGSRATLRLDDPARGWQVAFVCAEALSPGVASMRGDGSINQRAASTAQWIGTNKRNLLQPDLLDNPQPAPPAALLQAYGAKAQMLGPLLDDTGYLAGWISIHYVDGPHALSQLDSAAMDRARAQVAHLVGLGDQGREA